MPLKLILLEIYHVFFSKNLEPKICILQKLFWNQKFASWTNTFRKQFGQNCTGGQIQSAKNTFCLRASYPDISQQYIKAVCQSSNIPATLWIATAAVTYEVSQNMQHFNHKLKMLLLGT